MALSDWEKAKQKYGLSKSTTQSESSWELAKRAAGLSSAKSEPVSSKPTYNRSADRRVTSPSVSAPEITMEPVAEKSVDERIAELTKEYNGLQFGFPVGGTSEQKAAWGTRLNEVKTELDELRGYKSTVGKALTGAGKSWLGSLLGGGAAVVDSAGGTQATSVYEDELADIQKRREYLIADMNRPDVTPDERAEQEWQLNQYDERIKVLSDAIRANENAGTAGYQAASELIESGAQDVEAAKQGKGKVGQFLIDTGVAGAQMAADAVAAAGTMGAVNPLVAAAVRGGGGKAVEARNDGKSAQEALGRGVTEAVKTWAIGKLFSGSTLSKKYAGAGAADDFVDDIATRFASRVAKSEGGQNALAGVFKFGASGVGEGLEELLEKVADPTLDALIYGDADELKEYGTAEYWGDALYEGLIGAAMGFASGGIDAVTGKYAPNTQNAPTGEFNGDGERSPLTVAQTQNIMVDTNADSPVPANVETAKTMLQSGAPASRVFAETGVVVMANGDLQDGVGGTVYRGANHAETSHDTRRSDIYGNEGTGVQTAGVRDSDAVSGRNSAESRQGAPRVRYRQLSDGERNRLISAVENNFDWESPEADAFLREFDDDIGLLTEAIYNDFAAGRVVAEDTWARLFVNPDATFDAFEREGLPEGMGAASAGYAYRALQNDPNVPMHEAGEKPARPVNMPAIDVEGRNTSQTVRTALEAGATPDAMVPTIENLVAAGEFSYDPTTNAEVRAKAEETVANGFETAFAKWKQDIEKRASAETTALGWSLYNEAAKSGKAELAIEILGDMASYQRGNAQALQAQRILKTLSPEGQLYHMQRTVEKLAEKYAGKKGVDIKLDKELAAEFLAAKTDAERNAAIEKIQQSIADQIPSTAMDKFTALRYVNMLGNFKTQIRNLSSNTLMKLVGSVRYDVAAAIEALANKASGGKFEKTKSLHVGKTWMDAAKQDFGGVRDSVLGESKYGDNSPMDGFARGIENKRTIFKNKALEGYRKATNWAMEGGDLLFSKSAYARALSGWLKARGFTPEQLSTGQIDAATMDAARAYAIKEAQEATFRDNNAFSTWFSRLGRKESTPKAVKALSEGVMPFRKTPANILIRAVEYSPANLIDTLIIKPVQAKQGKVTGNDIVDSAAKSLTGTGLFLLGMALRSSGLLRGGSDEDERDINNLKGLQDYSLEIPGYGTYTFDWAAPSALTMFTGAQLQDLLDDGEITWADMEDALMSLADPMLEMSMLSGVDSALSNVKYSDYSLIQLAGTMALGYVTQGLTNTLVGQIERITEPNRMTTYTDKDSALPVWLQREIGKVSAKTPIWDYQQTEYQDELGRAESSGGVAERIFENLFSPGYFEPVNKDKAANWAVDLQEELNANKVDGNVLPNANTTTSVNQTPLTQGEKERFKRVYGETYSDVIEALSGSDLFNDLTLSQKSQVGEELKQFATDKAKRDIAAERGEKYESDWDDEAALPITSLAEVLIYGKALSSVKKEVVEAKSYSAMDALLETASGMSEDALSVMDEKPLFTRMLEAYAGANIGSEKFMNTQTAISALGQKAKFPEKADVILNSDALNEEQKWYMLSDAKNLQSGAKDKAATAKALGIPMDVYVSSERAIADAKAEKGKDSLSNIEIRRALGKLRADARVTNMLFRIYANDDHINWQYAK